MSGPIVRKYGFANFEKIFGERELKHGVDGAASTTPSTPSTAADPAKPAPSDEPAKANEGSSKP
jgi:hypothetical protein